VRVWDLDKKDIVQKLSHEASVLCLCVSTDGKIVWTGSEKGALRSWDLGSAKETKSVQAHGGSVAAIALAPAGKALATTGQDGFVSTWSLDLTPLKKSARGHASGAEARPARCIAWSRDGSRLASCGNDAVVRVWDAKSGEELRTFSAGEAWGLAFTATDKCVIASIATPPQFLLLDLASGRIGSATPSEASRAIALSSDGSVILSASNKKVHQWKFTENIPTGGIDRNAVLKGWKAPWAGVTEGTVLRVRYSMDASKPQSGTEWTLTVTKVRADGVDVEKKVGTAAPTTTSYNTSTDRSWGPNVDRLQDEALTISGTAYDCEVYEIRGAPGPYSRSVKIWKCPKAPMWAVRIEISDRAGLPWDKKGGSCEEWTGKEESITIGGKSLKCGVMKVSRATEAGQIIVVETQWIHDEVPCGIAKVTKQTFLNGREGTPSLEEVLEIRRK